MTVSCEYVNERLSAYLDGECDAEESAMISAHLNECEQCAALAKSLKALEDVLPQAFQVTPPASMHEGILAALEQVKEKRRERRMKLLHRWTGIAAAASILVCALIGVSVYMDAQRKAEQLANAQRIAPVQQGFAYEMHTQWGDGVVDFSVPENMAMYADGENVWKSDTLGAATWTLTVDQANGTVVLSNSANSLSWEGVASFDEDGSLTRLEFGELIYRVSFEKDCIRLIIEE